MSDRPKAVFIGKTYDLKKDPDGPRKLVTFDKFTKRDDGTWKTIKAVSIQYEDGSEVALGAPILIKPHEGEKGKQRQNIYFMDGSSGQHELGDGDDVPF